MWVGIIQSIKGQIEQKGLRKGQFSLLSWDVHLFLPLDTGVPRSLTLGIRKFHQLPVPSPMSPHPESQGLGLRPEIISSATLVLRPLDLD